MGFRPNGFRDRPVMTASIPLHICETPGRGDRLLIDGAAPLCPVAVPEILCSLAARRISTAATPYCSLYPPQAALANVPASIPLHKMSGRRISRRPDKKWRRHPDLNRSNRGFAVRCLTTWLWRHWSGQRDSNSLPPPWQGGALPNELCPQMVPQARIELATRGFSVRCSTY